MSATTVNSFPSINNWSSPRAWALAIIVLLHVGFFYALTHGLSINSLVFTPPPLVLTPTPEIIKPQKKVIIDEPIIDREIDVTVVEPEIKMDPEVTDTTTIFREKPTELTGQETTGPGSTVAPTPEVLEPRIDSRRGLSEPYYPPAEIRAGAEGTVVLSIYILADGRVGDVRLVTSSGHEGLDKSAMREAKKWRFIPGTSDGQPMAMWKQLPVTFRLNTRM